MSKLAKEVMDHLLCQAHHLHEQSAERPEYEARNDAAVVELNALALQFENDDVDEDSMMHLVSMTYDFDGAAIQTQRYKTLLEDVGFGSHFDTADDFLAAAIAAAESVG